MLLQQVAKGQNCDLISDGVADQVDAGKAEHGGHLDQSLFHRTTAERIPLLLQVDPQHGGQGSGRPATLLAGFGVKKLDQRHQGVPWDHRLHFGE